MFRVLVLIICGVQAASAATHSLSYFYTGTAGIPGFPEFVDVGVLDGVIISYYDSRTQKKVPKQPWMAENLDQQYWERGTQNLKGAEQTFKANIGIAMKRFNQTVGVRTFQRMYGCEWDEETGATGGFQQYGYDGGDFIVFDLKTLSWTAPVQQAFLTKQKWDANTARNEYLKNYFTQECIKWLKKYVDYGRETLNRRERPQVSVFHKDSRSGSTELTCLATGFFPRDILMSWWRDGQELHENVDSGEVLPNGDGSFQVRKSLRVRAGEEDKYSCRVDHKSLSPGEDIVRKWEPPSSSLVPNIAAVCAVVALAVIAVVAVVLVRRRKSAGGQKPIYRQTAGKEPGDSSSNSST